MFNDMRISTDTLTAFKEFLDISGIEVCLDYLYFKVNLLGCNQRLHDPDVVYIALGSPAPKDRHWSNRVDVNILAHECVDVSTLYLPDRIDARVRDIREVLLWPP